MTNDYGERCFCCGEAIEPGEAHYERNGTLRLPRHGQCPVPVKLAPRLAGNADAKRPKSVPADRKRVAV